MHHTNPIQNQVKPLSNFAKSSHTNANPPFPPNVKQVNKVKFVDRRISVSKTIKVMLHQIST